MINSLKNKLLGLLFFPLIANALCQVVDDEGKLITLAKPAARVIALAPDITETLFAIGGEQQLVASVEASDYPPAALKLKRVGSYRGVDLELIFSLKPDLIVTWGQLFARPLEAVKKQGVAIYHVQITQLEDIPRTMQHLGCLLGKERQANEAAKQFTEYLNELREKYKNKKEMSVFYQITPYQLITVNKDSWINQVLTLCRGRNIFAKAPTISPEITWESLLAENPRVIISSETNEAWKHPKGVRNKIAAVKQKAIYTINPDLLHRASPRLLQGAEIICQQLEAARELYNK